MSRAKTISKSVLVALTGMASLSTLSASASAQSFDCRNSAKSAERAVCGSDNLSALDDRMSQLYDQLLSGSNRGTRNWVRSYQHRFLQARNACGRGAIP